MIGNKLKPFKFWCQKVLPNVYDDSLSYYEYLCKLNEYLNEVIGQINTLTDNMSDYEEDLTATWLETKEYIDNYFNNLDVQQEINNKLDNMVTSGELSALLSPIVGTQIGGVVAEQIGGTVAGQIDSVVASQIGATVASQIDTPTATATNAWLTAHVNPVGSAVIVDNTLTIRGAAADAKITGDDVTALTNRVDLTQSSTMFLSERSSNGFTPLNTAWQKGNVNAGVVEAYNQRACTTNLQHFNYDIRLYCNSGYRINVSKYNSSGVYSGQSGWVTEHPVWTNDANNNYFRVTVKAETEPPTMPIEVFSFASQVTFISASENDKQKRITNNTTNITVNEIEIGDILDNVNNINRKKITLGWRQGAWNDDGTYGTETRSIHATPILIPSGRYKLTFDTTYNVFVRYVDNREFTSTGEKHGWYTTSPQTLTMPSGYYYLAITVRKNDSGIISPSDITNSDIGIEILGNSPSILNKIKKPSLSKDYYCIGHRGYPTDYPENTLIGFAGAVNIGLNSIETDVQYTSDGVPVLMHDRTINRTGRNADGSEISETYTVADLTYADLMNYDFGIYKGSQFAGTKICTLDEFLVFCHRLGIIAFIEITPNQSWSNAIIEDFVNRIKKYDMVKNSEVHSYVYASLQYIAQICEELTLCMTADNVYESLIDRITSLQTNFNRVGVLCTSQVYTDSTFVASLVNNGFLLFCSYADSSAELLALPESANGALTNGMDILAEFKNHYGISI